MKERPPYIKTQEIEQTYYFELLSKEEQELMRQLVQKLAQEKDETTRS